MMSFPNQTPHMFPYIPPPYIHPPMGIPINSTAPVIISKPPLAVPAPPPENNLRFSAFERPITTVFIGNISEKITDALMKDVLSKCGNVLSWKRVQGASGKLQAFGFCEYDNPEATLRCIRLLNDFFIADKALVVKVDPKTDELLTDYKTKKQKAIEDREAEDVTRTEDEKKERINLIYAREVDEDRNALSQVKKLIKESGTELGANDSDKKEKKSQKNETLKNLNIDENDLEGDKSNLIYREIEMFRNKHKDDDTNDGKDRYKRISEREKERHRERERERERDRDRDRERSKDTNRHRRHRTRSRSKPSRQVADEDRQRKISRADSRSSSILSKKRRSGSKDTHKSSKRSKRDSDKDLDEYETAIFKKLEKKLRDKEAAYQKRLQAWELREKKRLKEYELEKERTVAKENEIAEEARKLQIFFEDYDDEKWDSKYYRGTELDRRLASRRAEEVADEKDRLKELEQIESTRQRLLKEQNPNVEAIILRMEQSMQEHLQKRLKFDFESVPVVSERDDPIEMSVRKPTGVSAVGSGSVLSEDETPTPVKVSRHEKVASGADSSSVDFPEMKSEQTTEENGKSVEDDEHIQHVHHHRHKSNAGSSSHKSLGDSDTDTGVMVTSKSHIDTLSNKPNAVAIPQPVVQNTAGQVQTPDVAGDNKTPATGETGSSSTLSSVERKALVKNIIDGIPTIKADLFAYPIEWDMIDEVFVELRIKPWVDKKIVAYIGEEEPSLSKFICDQVLDHKTPDQILADIAMVLEEEADVFVMKMWRLLIYVIEEKKAGLDKLLDK